MSLLLIIAVLLSGMRLNAQPPDLTDVRFLPGDDLIGAAAGDQSAPAIVRGGNTFLAVWVDERTDMIPNLIGDESAKDIYAVRLDAGGNLLDAVPVVVNQDGGAQSKPVVAWNGENWLIAWVNQAATQFYYTDQIVAIRLSPDGILLDAEPIPLVTFETSGNGELYDVASDGANWVVAWKDYVGNQWKVQGVRISPQGIVLDGNPVTLHTTTSQPYQGRMYFAQNEYLLVWKEWRYPTNDDLLARRFTSSLQQMESNAFLVTSHNDYDTHPDIVSNGTDFFVVWERYNTCCVGGGGKVYGARINSSGTVLDPGGIAISGYVGATIGREPTAAWDGTNYFVGGVLSYDLFAARVSSGGSVLDLGGFSVGSGLGLMYDPDLAGNSAGGALMVWQDNRAGGSLAFDIFRASISAGGVVANEGVISPGAPTQIEADAQAHDSGFMIAYRSELSGVRRIMAQPLDGTGNPVTPAPILLASGPTLDHPALAWNGSLFLVTWSATDVPLIYGMRISANGTLIDSSPFTIMPGITPDIAALGDTFLVVGTHNEDVEFRHPYAVRVRGSDGVILDTNPRLLGQYFAQNPSVTTLGGRWIATWQRNFSHDDNDANINATFIAPNGVPTPEFIVSGTFSRQLYTPAVASDGSNALIVWRDSRNGASNIDVYGRLVLPDGTMQPEIAVASEQYNQDRPAVAWTGSEYVVVYQDKRNIPFFFDTRSDIYATRLDATGQLLDPEGFPVTNESVPEVSPTTTGGGGVGLLGASLFQSQSPFTSYRAGYRFMGLETGGIPCADIFFFNAKCNASGAAQSMVKISGDYAGETVTFDLDGSPQVVTLQSNGTNSIGKMTVPHAGMGSHTVTLIDPVSCYAPVTFNCQTDSPPDPEWDALWAEYETMEEMQTAIPAEVRILGNYPNPFNPTTSITYAINVDGFVSLKVYNSLGEEVAALVSGFQTAGYKLVTWNGRNDAGAAVASGLYFYRLTAGNEVRTAKMMFMK